MSLSRRTLFSRLSAVALAPLVKLLPKGEANCIIGCDVASGPSWTSIGPIRLPNHTNVFIDTTGDPYNWSRTYGKFAITSEQGLITVEPIPQEEA
jgi:hypothetical protein